MQIVIIPLIVFIVIVFVKKIPFVGGNLSIAFVLAGITALVISGITSPVEWFHAWLCGLDKLAYILWIVLFGSIFAAIQVKTGSIETVLRILHAHLGKSAQGIVLCALIVMYIGGALMGTVVATAAVVGVLLIPILDELGMSPEKICALLVTGGSMGAVMPPVSNAIIIACSLTGARMEEVTRIAYVSIGIGCIFVSWFFCKVYIGKKYVIKPEMISHERARDILRENWKKLIPLAVLLTLVLLSSAPDFDIRIPGIYAAIRSVRILGSITNNVVSSLLAACIVGYFMHIDQCAELNREILFTVKNSWQMIIIQLGAAVFLGAFTVGGQMDAIIHWVSTIDALTVKIGGGLMLVLTGMLLGAQSTSQNLLTPILGPAWIATGVSTTRAAAACAHLAAAGQGLPPADVNTFSIAGLVGAILHKPVNPLKSMWYTSFYCIYLAAAGFLFLLID